MKPEIGSEEWHRQMTTALQDAVARLASVEHDAFEDELRAVFSGFHGLLDVIAIGESTVVDNGVISFDPDLISPELLHNDGAVLRGMPDADGPFSCIGSTGNRIVAAPATSASFSRFTAVVAANPAGLHVEATRALGVLSAIAGAARQRVQAERSLHARVANQSFLNELSLQAATGGADDVTLGEMLNAAREALGVAAVTTLARDQDHFVVVASTDIAGEDALPVGHRSDADLAVLMEMSNAGHLVRGIAKFEATPESFANTVGQVLAIPRVGSDGVDGMVVFTDLEGRDWSPVEIETGKSVARSIQKLALRTEAAAATDRRHAIDLMLSHVASIAASTSVESFDEVLHQALDSAISTFGLATAGIWAFEGENAVRLIGAKADGTRSHETMATPFGAEMRSRLVADGYAFSAADTFEISEGPRRAGYRMMSVPIGSEPSGMILFGFDDRWWSAEEIGAAKTLGTLAEHTRVRLRADAILIERLRTEALVSAVSSAAAEARLEHIDAVLPSILTEIALHFGVIEASIWRFDAGAVRCPAAVRTDENAPAVGWEISLPDDVRFESGSWSVARLGSLDLGANEQVDPDDSKLIILGFGSREKAVGALVLNDLTNRWWDDDTLGTARAIADILGQLELRVAMATELAAQRAAEALLAESSSNFVNATLDDARDVVHAALESFRAHLKFSSITLLELDAATLQIHAPCEVTDDGLPLLASSFPMQRDHPSIARLLDPSSDAEWRLGDLFPSAARLDDRAIVNTAVRGRDLLFLVGTLRNDEFSELGRSVMSSLTALLAQLRRRLLLETQDRRRREADSLIGSIARSFVEQPPLNHQYAIEAALARIGEFCGMQAIGQWDIHDDGSGRRVFGWHDPDLGLPLEAANGEIDADHKLATGFASVEESLVFGLTAHHDDVRRASGTAFIQRLQRPGFGPACLVGLIPRPLHVVADVEIYTELLESVARLMEQLWRRADADMVVAQQLTHEDLLRRFATQLVTAKADEPEVLQDAFADLLAEVGIDHATIWHFVPSAEGFDVSAVMHSARGDVGPLPDEWVNFSVPPGATDRAVAPHLHAPITVWSLDEAAPQSLGLLKTIAGDGPRQIAVLPAPGGDPSGESSYLLLSRPGSEEFRSAELDFFKSAHSILLQHQGRVAAERYFTAAFNSAPVGISLRDADMTFVHCNQAYCDLVGRSREELANTDLYDVMPRDMADERWADTAEPFDTIEVESCYRRPDGTIRWGAVRVTPVHIPGRREPLMMSYVEDITERRRNREMLEYQATHDELTGLPNRRALVAEISSELERPGDCAVLVLDLDRFKVVNDSLGHSVGDQLLITCADRIRLSLRPGDSVCRLGGDEFAILLRAPADHHAAGVVAERLLSLLREPVIVGDDEVFPSASIGVAIPQSGDTVEDLLRHADAAMYQAKGQGRDRWDAFDGSMRQAVVDRIRTETDLRRAIDNGQLEVHYQPEFLLETGEIVGSEALVRWRHPERGLLAAGSFISLAEETGLVVDLGRWVLGKATEQGARWVADGHDIVTRVNLSARQLRGAVVAEVKEALERASLSPQRLCLELTETAIMDDVQESARILAQFRELGVQVAIDDFGTGFSSLAYLKRFPVDILKIDRTFVDGVGVDPDDTAIVRSVIGLARTLRLEVVAEGIEDATQVGELVRLGCGRGQGFHLARPAPADDVSMLLAGNQSRRRDSHPE